MATCAKCGERECSGKQRWCSRCRKGKGNRENEHHAGRENAVLPENASRENASLHGDRACPACGPLIASMAAELERLRLDVGRLKTELSEARKAAGDLKVVDVPRAPRPSAPVALKAPERTTFPERRCAGPGRCASSACVHPGFYIKRAAQ